MNTIIAKTIMIRKVIHIHKLMRGSNSQPSGYEVGVITTRLSISSVNATKLSSCIDILDQREFPIL